MIHPNDRLDEALKQIKIVRESGHYNSREREHLEDAAMKIRRAQISAADRNGDLQEDSDGP